MYYYCWVLDVYLYDLNYGGRGSTDDKPADDLN